jgi:hypothetical protein
MSCFDLTKTLCDQICTIICRFWWAEHDKENKMHWLSWELLTKPKREGGLGFRDLYGFNLAMLARQGWRMLTNPNSLCARVLKARYYPSTSILEAKATVGISYSWRSILKGVNLMKEGLVWRIGDGPNVRIWEDQWLNRDGCRMPITPRQQNLLTRVEELINPVTGQWYVELVMNTFWEVVAKIILSTPIRGEFEDFPAWHYDTKGVFSVKSAYKVFLKRRDDDNDSGSGSESECLFWKKLWDLPLMRG